MKCVNVGLVGSGFAAELHMQAYKRVYGVNVRVTGIHSRGNTITGFAQKHEISTVYSTFRDMLSDREIDVIDICSPSVFHEEMVFLAVEAGKHVICEKPFLGYFGCPGDAEPIGRMVSKKIMYERVLDKLAEAKRRIQASGRLFMYAENWLYAPSIAKTAEFIRETGDKVLFIKGENSLSGSHSPDAAHWRISGGGALHRIGCHPLSAILLLKQVEADRRKEDIRIESIVCDVGSIGDVLTPAERVCLDSRPLDVEDWAMLNITFTDKTKATVFAGDVILGGVRNLVEVYTNGGVMFADMVPNNHMVSYMTDESKLKNIYLREKIDRKTGWQQVSLGEEWTRGYVQEMQDFAECVAFERLPVSGLALAADTVKATYAAYYSAEEGCRILL